MLFACFSHRTQLVSFLSFSFFYFVFSHVFFMFCATSQLVHCGREVTTIHNFSCFIMHFFMFFVNSQLVSGCSEVRRCSSRIIVFLVVSLLAGLKTLKFCIFLQFLNTVLLIGNFKKARFPMIFHDFSSPHKGLGKE